VEGSAQLCESNFVTILGRLLSTVQPEREEIVRLLAFVVGQLQSSTVFIENAYDNDILRLFRVFQTKHYVDGDLAGQIGAAAEGLHQGLKRLSLWDKYVREVNSGTLRFSVSHKSEFFWKAHIERFGDNHYYVLGLLAKLLQSSDPETVTVAVHDLGEYAVRSPIGRVKLEELGAKEAVMRLMSSSCQQIQREALRTTQLLLLRNQTPV
jgi:V-type H+-transporting ATPase subunit H